MQTVTVGIPDAIWELDWLSFLFECVSLDIVTMIDMAPSRPTIILWSDSDGSHLSLVASLLCQLSARGGTSCLVHLSDEYNACPINCYANADVVIRNYFRPAAALMPHCMHVPLGYKSGFKSQLTPRPIQGRQHRWFFAGEIKGARQEMLNAADRVSGGLAVGTRRWNDPSGLNTAAYADNLADSVFALCPRGNDSVECFRVWEALEAGAIPIVEDDGNWEMALNGLFVPTWLRRWRPPRGRVRFRAKLGESYWKSSYGSGFPLPRVFQWHSVAKVISTIDVPTTSDRVELWWTSLKVKLQSEIRRRLIAGRLL